MELSAPSLLTGVMFSSLLGVANAGEPGVRVETPPILSSINVSGYQLLGKAEMAEITGTVISNGTYSVYWSTEGSTIPAGTANIYTLPDGSGRLYSVIYVSPSAVKQEATGLEQGNSLAVVWDATPAATGVQTTAQTTRAQGLALYTLGSDGRLSGYWTVRDNYGTVESPTAETLVPALRAQ